MKNLPEKLSDCLIQAMIDVEIVEQRKDVRIDVSWFVFKKGTSCTVCIAGASMLQTLNVGNLKKTLTRDTPGYYSKHNEIRLYALDYLRNGYIYRGLKKIGIEDDKIWGLPLITSYKDDRIQFKKDMQEIVEILQANNY